MTMTQAMKKADTHRDQIMAGATKFMAKDYSCVVYVYTDVKGRPCARGFKGRSLKPSFANYFRNEERRKEFATEWMNKILDRNSQKKESSKRELEVGDVLKASWGYDQTNVDYYLVTRLVGKASVEIVEIGQHVDSEGGFQGKCSPDVTNIIGEPMTKRANGNAVKVGHTYAFKQEAKVVAGVKVFDSSSWTAHA